jgi:putative FmdB family regulatory protein
MPTYEYECKSCGYGFEVFQSMSDPPLKDCPECGREVRRLIFGGTGVIFKGSGFYVTDKAKSGGETLPGKTPAEVAGKPEVKQGESKKSEGGAVPANSAPVQSPAGGKTSESAPEKAKSEIKSA